MPTVTLLAKAYNSHQLRHVDQSLKSEFKDLKVETKILGTTSLGWIQISISGQDETPSLHYLSDRFGFCPITLENINKFSTIEGRVAALRTDESVLRIDIGVFSPQIIDAAISLQRLQTQIGEGKKTPLKKITRLYGLCRNLPITVKILHIDNDEGYIEAELAESQQRRYIDWNESLLDRLLIMGASQDEIELTLERARLDRDVIDIEPLGMFEHAVVCKLGTDAAGLIPKIGKQLRGAFFSVFRPKTVLEFFEGKPENLSIS
jgi:hypothetical protein